MTGFLVEGKIDRKETISGFAGERNPIAAVPVFGLQGLGNAWAVLG
jgi:hypothetical protein